MDETTLYSKLSKKYQYKDLPNWNPGKPFIIWANTNSMLDNFYKRPEINIDNSSEGLKRKNTMRHITGLGLATREYAPFTVFNLGALKEFSDLFTHKDLKNTLQDTKVDILNNARGFNFMRRNKTATPEDLMEYAYDVSLSELGGLENSNTKHQGDVPLILKGRISNTMDLDSPPPRLFDLLTK